VRLFFLQTLSSSLFIISSVLELNNTTDESRNSSLDQEDDDLPSEDDQKKMLIKIHQEFWDLPTNYQEKPLVFGSQSKNRYKTILPNEHSRVVLQAETGSLVEPYINANFVKVSTLELKIGVSYL
jgi:protein tyrosine phosphatase